MANELYWKLVGRYAPANASAVPASVGTIETYDDQVGTDFVSGTQQIGTTEEQISWSSDIGDEGWMVIRNLDPTNYVQVGFATGVYGMRIYPGQFAVFPAEPGLSIYVKANTAACQVQYFVYEA